MRAKTIRRAVLCLCMLAAAAGAAAQGVPGDWVAHYRAGAELFVAHPPGWRVEEFGGGAFRVWLPGPDGEPIAQVYAKPLRLSARHTPLDALRALPRDEARVLPGARVEVQAQDVHGREALGEIRHGAGGPPQRGRAMVLAQGPEHGMLFVISERERSWPSHARTMAAVLRHFAYLPPGAGAVARPLPALQAWRDPVEGAFTLPVPQGWSVRGGLSRPGGVDLRAEVVAASPDGTIEIRIGDASVPTFGAPYQVPFVGMTPEGTLTAGGTVIWRYLPGQAFLLHYYLPRRFGPLPNAQARPLPAWAEQSFRTAPSPPPMQGRADAGEVFFELATPGGPRQFWYGALTRYSELPGVSGSGGWSVETLVGIACSPGRMEQAQTLLAAMHRGFAWNPRWRAAELRMRGEVAQAVMAHNSTMNDIVAQTAEQRAGGGERAAAPRSAATRGELRMQGSDGQTVIVPITGAQDYYRQRAGGQVVASDRPDLPAFDFDRLWRAP